MYDAAGWLVENADNIYSVGDRGNMTSEVGTRIYTNSSGSDSQTSRTFQILIQPADVAPPANWTSKYDSLSLALA
jgi:hypothetical protein